MKEEKKKTKKEEKFPLDIGLGRLGGFFKGLESLVSLASAVAEKGGEIRKQGEIKGLGKDVRGVYGFSIRTLEGKPFIERFGNIKETPKGPVIEEEREPIADVFDEHDHILIVAEMPGIEKDDIHLEFKEGTLFIKGKRGNRKYRKELTLPTGVDPQTASTSYRNGVFEIKIGKVK